jgi:hypothetical protein
MKSADSFDLTDSRTMPVWGGMPSSVRSIRLLVWLYFWLLLFEGALRKWIFPAWSAPLLIARDPVVLAIYFIALAKGIFPFNRIVVTAIALAGLSFGASLFVFGNIGVILYGIRTNFLHVPLIFLVPKLFTQQEVIRVGRWLLFLALPMTPLVGWQFASPAGSWVNAATGGDLATQMIATGSHIRPAGIFSFVTGMVSFLSVAAAFLLDGFLERGTVPAWLRTSAVPCLMFSLVLSGSRSALASITIIIGAVLIVCIRRFSKFSRVLGPAVLSYVVFVALCYLPLFRQGLEVHEERLRAGEGVQKGIIARYFGDLGESMEIAEHTPPLGYGLGIGTNAGATLLTGSRAFLLGESEWSRVVGESGPVLGYAYILLRVWIGWFVLRTAWRALQRDKPMPLLLLAAAGFDLISGQFGQPTTLGFAVFTTGLALASVEHVQLAYVPPARPKPARPARGRSVVAEAVLQKTWKFGRR